MLGRPSWTLVVPCVPASHIQNVLLFALCKNNIFLRRRPCTIYTRGCKEEEEEEIHEMYISLKSFVHLLYKIIYLHTFLLIHSLLFYPSQKD